jgi:hypothetical protein
LHIYAAHAHTAAAAAHHRGDHEAAEELSSRAQEYSMEAAEKTNADARQTPEPARLKSSKGMPGLPYRCESLLNSGTKGAISLERVRGRPLAEQVGVNSRLEAIGEATRFVSGL